MSLDIRLVSSSIGSWVINTRRIEAEEEEKKTGKTIVHSKTVVLIIMEYITDFKI